MAWSASWRGGGDSVLAELASASSASRSRSIWSICRPPSPTERRRRRSIATAASPTSTTSRHEQRRQLRGRRAEDDQTQRRDPERAERALVIIALVAWLHGHRALRSRAGGSGTSSRFAPAPIHGPDGPFGA